MPQLNCVNHCWNTARNKPSDKYYRTSMNPRVVLENNTANYAGSALYGGWIDICQMEGIYTTNHDFNSLFQVNEWN